MHVRHVNDEKKEQVLDAIGDVLRDLAFEFTIKRHPGQLEAFSEGTSVFWFHFSDGRLLGRGSMEGGHSSQSLTISADARRDNQKVAADVSRRLIVPHLARWRAGISARSARRKELADADALRAELAGTLRYERSLEDRDRFSSYFRGRLPGGEVRSVNVDVVVSPGEDGGSCYLHFKYVSPDQARKLAACLVGTFEEIGTG